jgi:hypothetical protein
MNTDIKKFGTVSFFQPFADVSQTLRPLAVVIFHENHVCFFFFIAKVEMSFQRTWYLLLFSSRFLDYERKKRRGYFARTAASEISQPRENVHHPVENLCRENEWMKINK